MGKGGFGEEEDWGDGQQAAHCKNDEGTDVTNSYKVAEGCGNKRPKDQDKKKRIQHGDPGSLARWRTKAPQISMQYQRQHGNKAFWDGRSIGQRGISVKGLGVGVPSGGQKGVWKKAEPIRGSAWEEGLKWKGWGGYGFPRCRYSLYNGSFLLYV